MSGRSLASFFLDPGGRLGDQLMEEVFWKVLSKADILRKDGIPLGAPHQQQETGGRKLRAVIGGNRRDHVPRSPGDQDVGHGLGNRFAFRDREQMLLALASRAGDERRDVEAFRMPQHRPCDLDRIVGCQLPDDGERRVVAPGQLAGQPDARAMLDLFGEPADDLAKGPDLLFRIGPGNQRVRRMPQRAHAAFGGAPGNRIFQIRQERAVFNHPTLKQNFRPR
jgi:hypothetical protein